MEEPEVAFQSFAALMVWILRLVDLTAPVHPPGVAAIASCEFWLSTVA